MNVKKWLMSLFIILVNINLLFAEETKRIELSSSYDFLNPKNPYGNWKIISMSFFHRLSPTFNYFLSGGFHERKEGTGLILTGGAYKDWSERLYSYSAMSVSTTSSYLPKYRLDHEFYYKLGERKVFLPSIGLSYIRYHDVHKDFLISLGFVYYTSFGNISFKHFINRSDPGKVKSCSELISIGIGREKRAWTYIDVSFGKQAYLATYLATPEEVRQDSYYVSLSHRRWITKTFGIMGSFGYFKLEKGYERYGLGAGIFKEF